MLEERGRKKEVRELQTASKHLRFKLHHSLEIKVTYANMLSKVKSAMQVWSVLFQGRNTQALYPLETGTLCFLANCCLVFPSLNFLATSKL